MTDRDYRAEVNAAISEMTDEELIELWANLCNLGRGADGPPLCDKCESFGVAGHLCRPLCARCRCPHASHDGPNGRCTEGAYGWSCDCAGYVAPKPEEKQ